MTTKLSDLVSVGGSFQRAMRLDRDYDATSVASVENWLPQPTALNVLEMMAQHIKETNQRAFTWTGPYGSGKSSLALLLCSLVGGGAAREEAVRRLNRPETDPVIATFGKGSPWTVFPITGSQTRLIDDLARTFSSAATERCVIEAFRKRIEAVPEDSGLLLIIDELGKYLEAESASENAYLLQELAETANRSGSKAIVVGILHQAVDVYASRLPRGVREEWEKVKGRFVDMPLLGTSDEVIELLGRAIEAKPHEATEAFREMVDIVAEEYARHRPNRAAQEGQMQKLLAKAWPLNPVMTMLLGPISRRKFSQNERSIYSFLCSREPHGLQEFLEENPSTKLYSPAEYWDYLKANFETSILTTGESHRWMTADDAVERTERKGTASHVLLAKTLALIDLFRSGSGIEASLSILSAAMMMPKEKTKALLKDLIDWKVAIERHHVNAYAIFAGSDFNLDEELSEAISHQNGIDIAALESLLDLTPVVARSLYMRMGTMRWFDRVVLPVEQYEKWSAEKREDDGTTGAFVLLIPSEEDDRSSEAILRDFAEKHGSEAADGFPVILGVPEEGHLIRSLLGEMQGLAVVAKAPELEGDETGRKEVAARTAQVRDLIIETLTDAFTHAAWFHPGTNLRKICRQHELTDIANTVADRIYPKAPVIRNELINRDFTSGNVTAARKNLMMQMIAHEKEDRLGFEGYPAEYALFITMLQELRIKDANGGWRFDTSTKTEKYDDLWDLTFEFIEKRPFTTAADIYKFWRKPPFGMRRGPMPLLALVFYLANRDRIALYLNKGFTPVINAAVIDEWNVDPSRIGFKAAAGTKSNQEFVNALAANLREFSPLPCERTPLGVARLLVRLILQSPKLSQNSTAFSPKTLQLKQQIMKASDPIDLLFRVIPGIYGELPAVELADAVAHSLAEYLKAMPQVIEKTRSLLFTSLKASPDDLESLKGRAASIRGLSGQMQLEAFISRIEAFGNAEKDVEGLISLAVAKPNFQWTDNDINAAHTKLADFAFAFRKLEQQGAVRGRSTHSRVVSLAFGSKEKDVTESVELTKEENESAEKLAEELRTLLSKYGRSVALAALADAGVATADRKE